MKYVGRDGGVNVGVHVSFPERLEYRQNTECLEECVDLGFAGLLQCEFEYL